MPKPTTPLLRWSEENQNYELSADGRLEQCFASEERRFSFLETHTSLLKGAIFSYAGYTCSIDDVCL